MTATLGARYETWHAENGENFAIGSNGVPVSINPPSLSRSGISPKASLTWDLDETWSLTGSFGRALRFPTVGELYQTVQTGTTFAAGQSVPRAGERAVGRTRARAAHRHRHGTRVGVDEYVSNALISQTSSIPGFATPVSFTTNVGETRETGAEVVAQQDDVLIKGLDLSGKRDVCQRAHSRGRRLRVDHGAVPRSASRCRRYRPGARRLPRLITPDSRWALTLAATLQHAAVQHGRQQR
ncbi:MAG: TonB-dependent receptor [Pararobbsia sp.]